VIDRPNEQGAADHSAADHSAADHSADERSTGDHHVDNRQSGNHQSGESSNGSRSQAGDSFTFAMGDFTAEFPIDLHYATNHMWARSVGGQRFQFGLTAYAVRLLQDVYFLDWICDPPAEIRLRGHIGSIESKKAESDLYAPIAGTLVSVNDATLSDPSLINADAYKDGWLIEIKADVSPKLLSPEQYAEHLVNAWEVAQRTIKGQANL
jgi:glycine cleavage system H protein